MNDRQFRAFLDLLMVSDPWPLEHGQDELKALAVEEAQDRGYQSWTEAYMEFEVPVIATVSRED